MTCALSWFTPYEVPHACCRPSSGTDPAMSLCRNCGFDPPKARGLCPACLQHEDRKGTPRPSDLILRHIDRKIWRTRNT